MPFCSTAAFSPDGGAVVQACYPVGALTVWSIESETWLGTLAGNSEHVYTVVFSPNGRFLVMGADKTLKLWAAPE